MSNAMPLADVYVEDRTDPEMALILDVRTLRQDTHYRFVQDRPTNVAKHKAKGYRLVSASKDGVKALVELERTADDTIRHSDMVLMCTSKELFQRRKRNKQELVRDRLLATHEAFKQKVDEARAAGIDVRLVDKYEDNGPPEPETNE